MCAFPRLWRGSAGPDYVARETVASATVKVSRARLRRWESVSTAARHVAILDDEPWTAEKAASVVARAMENRQIELDEMTKSRRKPHGLFEPDVALESVDDAED